MYDYRRMTPQQQKAILNLRQQRGFPLHRPPHLDQGAGWYLITGATFEHRRHFGEPRELTALELRLIEAFETAVLPCAAWVVLPNHYHALLKVQSLPHVGRAVGPVHGRSARYANQRDKAPKRQVWNRFSDRKIRSERHYWTTMHYIVMNPVKHGYVSRSTDWAWSCIHELLEENGPDWFNDLQRDYPLKDFGNGWDD